MSELKTITGTLIEKPELKRVGEQQRLKLSAKFFLPEKTMTIELEAWDLHLIEKLKTYQPNDKLTLIGFEKVEHVSSGSTFLKFNVKGIEDLAPKGILPGWTEAEIHEKFLKENNLSSSEFENISDTKEYQEFKKRMQGENKNE